MAGWSARRFEIGVKGHRDELDTTGTSLASTPVVGVTAPSPVPVYVVATDKNLMIARYTRTLIDAPKA
jgi:hypothetical protein